MSNENVQQHLSVIESIIAQSEKRIKHMTGLDVIVRFECPQAANHLHEDQAVNLLIKLCRIWNIDLVALQSRNRKRELAVMRKIAATYLQRKVYKIPLKQIASLLGMHHHTSALSAVDTFQDLLDANDALLHRYYEPVKHLF